MDRAAGFLDNIIRTVAKRTMVRILPGCIIVNMNQKIESSYTTSKGLQKVRDYCANVKPVWPFFVLLTVAMATLYGLSLANVPALKNPWAIVGFTLLMVIHTALHWISPLVGYNSKYSFLYILVQFSILLVLALFTRYETLILGLFMGLIGEMLGVVRPLKRSFMAVAFLIASVFVLHGLLFSWTSSAAFFITVIPLTFFVVIYVYLFTKQLDEKKHAEELLQELEVAHRQLSEYANQIEDLTLNNERQRMARELHDTLSQGLAGVILQLEAAGQHLENGNKEKAQAIIKQAGMRARSTLAEARDVIDDLRKNTSENESLEEFIHEKAEHFTLVSGLPCEVNLASELIVSDRLASQIEKIVSEGLTNVLRHAQANRCWVTMKSEEGNLQLEIGDDGQGFDAEKISQSSGHYGLIGMRERVRLNAGKMKIETAPGKGTRLIFTFLVPEKEEIQA